MIRYQMQSDIAASAHNICEIQLPLTTIYGEQIVFPSYVPNIII